MLGNLSPEKLASFMKLLSSLKPEQVQVLIKALGSLPKESLQLLLNSPQLLATIANLSPKNLQALLANLSNISPKLLANVMQLLQASGINSKQMIAILNQVGKLFANNIPQKVTVDAGADANTITESDSNPKPLVGVGVFCGCWITLLSDICICATRVTSASVPALNVALNFVFTPSKATLIV